MTSISSSCFGACHTFRQWWIVTWKISQIHPFLPVCSWTDRVSSKQPTPLRSFLLHSRHRIPSYHLVVLNWNTILFISPFSHGEIGMCIFSLSTINVDWHHMPLFINPFTPSGWDNQKWNYLKNPHSQLFSSPWCIKWAAKNHSKINGSPRNQSNL